MVGRETCPNKSPFSVSNFQFVHFSSTFPASLQYFSSFHKLNLESPPAACFLFFNFHKIYSNNTKFIVVSFYFSARKTFSFHLLVTDDAACLDGLGEKGGGGWKLWENSAKTFRPCQVLAVQLFQSVATRKNFSLLVCGLVRENSFSAATFPGVVDSRFFFFFWASL